MVDHLHKWVCPFCRAELDQEKGSVITHLDKTHQNIFDVFPNPIANAESCFTRPS